jgi:hypothetical protein
MIAAADFRRECDGSEVAGECADGSDAPEAGRGATERVYGHGRRIRGAALRADEEDRRAAAGESCRAGREGTGEVIGAAIDAFERKLYGKRRPTEQARGVGG